MPEIIINNTDVVRNVEICIDASKAAVFIGSNLVHEHSRAS